MYSKFFNKYEFQITNHWGNPFYLHSNKNDFYYFLTKETWNYARSKSKSIGILIKLDNSNKNKSLFFCLVIYVSGKIINQNRLYSVNLNKYLRKIMTDQMISMLNINEIYNNGCFLLLEESLFLVERGSLLLFSWNSFFSKWIQVPIVFLFSLFLNRLFYSMKLSEYLSYSFTRRSGYNLMPTENISNQNFHCIKIQVLEHQIYETNNFNTYHIHNNESYCNKEEKTQLNNFKFNYLIDFSKCKNGILKESKVNLLSRQPHELFTIGKQFFNTDKEFLISVISISSEIKLKVSMLEL